ncbi:Uncharacterised protein [uncultured archaeon]|nr:Uncharacterised protein [uncultured archaeon]
MRYSIYIAAFSLTLIVFLFGFLLGSAISEQYMSGVDSKVQQAKVDMEALDLSTQLLSSEQSRCDLNYSKVSKERWSMGADIERLEDELGRTHPQVIARKQEYYLIEIRDYLFMRNMVEKCGIPSHFVLYFYSNAGDCDRCEAQGQILEDVRQNSKTPVLVYSFDAGSDNLAVQTLKDEYGITGAPSLVIDDAAKRGFQSRDELAGELGA